MIARNGSYSEDHTLGVICTRQKSISGANPESPPRTQPEKNIGEVRTPSQTVFTQEHNALFVQQVVQYSQYLEGEDLHYNVIGLNEFSTEDYMKNSILNWLFD